MATKRKSPIPPLMPQQERSHATRRKLLDAAIEELLEVGYSQLTTSAVAARAGVSRGAQQHHFPVKSTLVLEAVRELADRQLSEYRELWEGGGSVDTRMEQWLELVFRNFRGPLFKAMVDLSLAARSDPELRLMLDEAERGVNRELRDIEAEILGDRRNSPSAHRRFQIGRHTARGIAILDLLGYPPDQVETQWQMARSELLKQLTEAAPS